MKALTVNIPSEHATDAAKLRFVERLRGRVRRHNNATVATLKPDAAQKWHREWFVPRNAAITTEVLRLRPLVHGDWKAAKEGDLPPWAAAKDEIRGRADDHADIAGIDLDTAFAGTAAAKELLDPYEDLTTFTESDPNNRLSYTTTRVTFTSLQRGDDSYAYKDYTASHFGDYTHDCEINVSSFSAGTAWVGHWGVTNDPGSFGDCSNGQLLFSYRGSNPMEIDLYDRGASNQDVYKGASAGTSYYVRCARASTTCTAVIYSNSGYTTVVDTLSITGQSTTWRYAMCAFTRDSSGTATASGYTQNFDFHEAAGYIAYPYPRGLHGGASVMSGGMQ